MDIKINPGRLSGSVSVPPSKSVAHRMIIAAALTRGESKITNLYPSVDIMATMDCMRELGAKIDFSGNTAVINGIENPPKEAVLDCHESGSTLRFLIPVACALGVKCTFVGKGKLPQRPITPLVRELPKHGITFDFSAAENGNTLPCTVSGKLEPGIFEMDGSISSQFITGLILALPILDGNSEIVMTSHLQSKPYVDITLGTIKDFGGNVTETVNGYKIMGNQVLKPFNGSVEGDYSQAAFFEVANVLGSDIEINGLNENSFQGDKKIIEICKEIVYNKNGSLNAFELDCSDIPDLVPILSVLASFCGGVSRITNAARLRLKECDRLAAMTDCINKIGGKVTEFEDGLEIQGVDSFRGGEVYAYNDHRIAMSMAIASIKCTESLIIKGAECVKKSYPDFFDVFKSLNGNCLVSDNNL